MKQGVNEGSVSGAQMHLSKTGAKPSLPQTPKRNVLLVDYNMLKKKKKNGLVPPTVVKWPPGLFLWVFFSTFKIIGLGNQLGQAGRP